MNTLKEIEQAIGNLTEQQIEELRSWLDQDNRPQPIDLRLEADLATGRIDQLIQGAVDDYDKGRTQPL